MIAEWYTMHIAMVFLIIGFVFLALWVMILTYLMLKQRAHYNSLTKGITDKNLETILEVLLKDVHVAQKEVAHLSERTTAVEKEGLFHLQKIGLLRFNPFNDTGGDQSFILAFVDGQDSGVVISGLYGRSGTRWYAKRVMQGKGVDHELSAEEKKALHLAKNS